MKIKDHILAARQGISHRRKQLVLPLNERDLVIGVMAGLSGGMNGVRRLKIDSHKRFGADRHYASRDLLDKFVAAHHPSQAKSYTHFAAACVCVLYTAGKLTKTVNRFKDDKPDNPVALLNDASTGPADIVSEIKIKSA